MKNKLEKILEDLNAGNVAQAKKTLANLVANFDSESRKAFASKGGAAGKGKAKTRSPEFYKELAAKGVAARQAKWDLVKRTKEDDEEEAKMKAEAAKNAQLVKT
tara:strand:- start:351 stop:662 length:312 start_codon:yes stop_codon:yes gene_type:complete